MWCQSKTLSSISSKPTFEDKSLNILLGIGIPELLLYLVSCHVFMKKPNSTVILNCRSRLISNHLSNGFYIIEKVSNKLNFLPNDVILRSNLNNQLDTYFVMAKKKANSIKKLHIHKYMHFIYKQHYYEDKQKEIDDWFIEYLAPIMDDIYHPELIE